MNKVWVVMTDHAYDGIQEDPSIIGIFSTYEKAKKVYDKEVEDAKGMANDNNYDFSEESPESYNTWVDGEWNNFHSVVTITDYELDKNYNPEEE